MAKKKKRTSLSPKGMKLLHFRNLMRGTNAPTRTLSEFRNSLSPAYFDDIIVLIKSNPAVRKIVFHPEYPKSVKFLKKTRLLAPTSIEREIKWAVSYLLPHYSKINIFLDFSKQFQDSLLRDDFIICENILDEIENVFGHSIWLIKNKLAFLQHYKGLESQKKYYNYIRENAPFNGIVPFIAHYVSLRNEPSISPNRFPEIFHQHLTSLSLSKEFAAFLIQHIDPPITMNPDLLVDTLRYESAGAVIDYYEMLLILSQIAFNTGNDAIFNLFTDNICKLAAYINDERITMLEFRSDTALSMDRLSDIDSYDVFTDYLKGNYKKAAKDAIKALHANPRNRDLKEIATRALSLISDSDLKAESPKLFMIVLKLMKSILSKESTIDTDITELLKISSNFYFHSWANGVKDFIKRETSDNPLETGAGLTNFCAISIPSSNPIRTADFISKNDQQLFHRLCNMLYGNNISIRYTESIAIGEVSEIEGLSRDERLLLAAEIAVRSGKYNLSLPIAKQLIDSPKDYYVHRSIRIIAQCMMKLERIEEAIDFITSYYVTNPHLHYIMPISGLMAILMDMDRAELQGNISVPILYDIYSRYIDNKYDYERNYSYEDFLFANGIQRPSQLIINIDKFDKRKIIHFFRYLCIEPIMDCSTVFNGSIDIAKERLSVCRILVELDPENEENYQGEIREILRRLMIKKRMREIEKSKIYIDIDSIKKTVDKTLRDTFNRYISFIKHGIGKEADLPRADIGKDPQNPFHVSLPKDEVNSLITDLIIGLRDEFVSSTEHGLDGYLSVRIRHGTLSGQLRSPIEAEKLVTRRDHITDLYKSNDYWIDTLNITKNFLKETLNKFLADFSEQFEQLVLEISNDWIQIKTQKSDAKGLFDFTLYENDIPGIARRIKSDTTFEEFLDLMFDSFNELLKLDLAIIRSKLEKEAKFRLDRLFNSLQANIDRIANQVDVGNLNKAVRMARTEMPRTIDRIIEWFHLSKSTSNEPFHVEDAINISTEMVRTYSADFMVNITTPIGIPILFQGKYLTSFVDILFIIFENIIRHSGVKVMPAANVSIKYDRNYIYFCVENDIDKDIKTDITQDRIIKIKEAMREKRYMQSIRKEGGTGFHKIRKIINHDFGIEPDMNFGFRGSIFYVEFKLPVTGYQL